MKKVAIVKEGPTIVTTMTEVNQDLANGSKCKIITTSRPYLAPKKTFPSATSKDNKVATPISCYPKKRSAEDDDPPPISY